jgi:hypothetical protein
MKGTNGKKMVKKGIKREKWELQGKRGSLLNLERNNQNTNRLIIEVLLQDL